MSNIKVKKTLHYSMRAKSRGIRDQDALFTLEYGEIKNDKFFTNRKIVQKLKNELDLKIEKLLFLGKKYKGFEVLKLISKALRNIQKLRSIAMRLLDKGGVTVIYDNNSLITAYQTNSFKCY
jgi:hypothetical protein